MKKLAQINKEPLTTKTIISKKDIIGKIPLNSNKIHKVLREKDS